MPTLITAKIDADVLILDTPDDAAALIDIIGRARLAREVFSLEETRLVVREPIGPHRPVRIALEPVHLITEEDFLAQQTPLPGPVTPAITN